MMDSAMFAVGIDLGTTQSVLACCDLRQPDSTVESITAELVAIPQVVAANTVEPRSTLPSFLYLTTVAEAAQGAFSLPWSDGLSATRVLGEWARQRSAEAPTRTVAAAKSWLCHHRVDRRQEILPWQAPAEIDKVSPVTAARCYLQHLAAVWGQAHPEAPLGEQAVVLTVPASFDASARELTREAALAAGLPAELVLLEEPQAALYAWLAERGGGWRRDLQLGDRLLVVDIGGGTTDFSLIEARAEQGELELERLAVGQHLLVGGDNMDLALAHLAQQGLADRGVQVDAWQSVALWHACRAAKESLLGDDAPASYPVSILGRGRSLIGGTVATELERQPVLDLLLEGFLPHCRKDARPRRQPASGFRQLGLPFATDTAISRHLAAFLAGRAPTRVLLNGGVLKAPALAQRLLDILQQWFPEAPPRLLDGAPDLDFAVARGAAFYGRSRQVGGVRIRGGVGRSYYLGIETAGLAVPGAPRPLDALCVVAQGMEEGSEVAVPGGEIGLVVGDAATFRFFSSTVRPADQPGDLLRGETTGDLVESDFLEAALETAEGAEDGFVSVRLRARLTELGVLELWCDSTNSKEQWKMELSVREAGPG